MSLETKYLGITLKNPVIVSSCPLSQDIDNIKHMETAGAAAIVMYSIFEEEIRADDDFTEYFTHLGEESFAEAITYFPKIENRESYLNQYLYKLKQAVNAVKIPIIGSLNACSRNGWMDYALKMQDTGISALELNLFHMPIDSHSSSEIEKEHLDIVSNLKSKIKIPLVVKLSPFFTSIPDVVAKLDKVAKVDGIVLFNRFYAPDVNINTFEVKVTTELSNSYETRLPLRWTYLLHDKVKCSIAASTGIQSSDDIIKYILVGADAITCASCLMKNGIDYIQKLLQGLEEWMKNKNYQSLDQFRGLISKKSSVNMDEFIRAQYMRSLKSLKEF